ncbi:MAG TPA: hypothetical protein VNI61_09165 [Gemmatimonadales bacterium]|nr:hypothetical protein [Gemmatimonadales bacterium]
MDKDKERQWDREMAEVDKLLARLPTYDPGKPALGGEPTLKRPAAGPPGAPAVGSAMGMWLKVGAGVVLALGVTSWPYSHVCGLKLMFYLVAVSTVVVAGVWAALASWKRRAGLAHVLSLVVVVWGLGLAMLAVLPRMGYSRSEALWFCPEPPTPIAPTPR